MPCDLMSPLLKNGLDDLAHFPITDKQDFHLQKVKVTEKPDELPVK